MASVINHTRKRKADGTIADYYYHRPSGKRLPGKPGDADYEDALAALEKNEPELGTLADVIRRFERSSDVAALAPNTRGEYARKFKTVIAVFGSVPLKALEARAFRAKVLDWRDAQARKRGPREADNLAGAIARVLSWGLDRGILSVNVLDKMGRVYRSDRAGKIWSQAHIRLWMSAASPEMQTAMLLLLGTAQRRGDIVKLKWSQYDGRTIRLVQSKTGAVVEIPVVSYLREHLDSLDRPSDYILTHSGGRPWHASSLTHAFMRVSRSVGITDLHMHDVRGTAITMMADAGASVPQIAAVSGHSLDGVGRILAAYLKPTLQQAQGAVAALERLGFDPSAQ